MKGWGNTLVEAGGGGEIGGPQRTLHATGPRDHWRVHGQQKQQSFLDSVPLGLHPQPGGRTETLGTFFAREESAYREVSDPRPQEVDQSSRLLDTCLQEESLPAESALTTGTQVRV